MRVVVLGDAMADVVALHDAPLAPGTDTPARVRLRPGGSAANVAGWLARAGAEVTLVCRVGTDPLADVALGGLDGVAVAAARDPGRPTGTCVVLVAPDGERTMLPDPGANAALAPADVDPGLFAPGAVLHVAGYALLRPGPRAAARAALALARGAGMRTSLDPSSAGLLAAAPALLELAGPVDLLLANEDEAPLVAEAGGPGERVVKLGARGARWTDGRRVLALPAPAARVVDTTGAGDAFAAGFLSAWDAGPEAALAAGLTLAAEAVSQPGGRPA